MPAHIFDVPRAQRASATDAGWHVAHLFEVKNRRTDYRSSSREDVVGYFTRNIHPCNHFLLPKAEWRRWGGDARVLAFFGERQAARYAEVWGEFLRLARVDGGRFGRVAGPMSYSYGSVQRRVRSTAAGSRVREYHSSRLTFERDVIESLAEGERFRCVAPEGAFEMTRAEFLETFPNVAASSGDRDVGHYNYTAVPAKAEHFRVGREQEGR